MRDAVKSHLDYLEWLRKSLDEAEQEAAEAGWLTTEEVSRTLATEAGATHPWPQVALTGRPEHSAT